MTEQKLRAQLAACQAQVKELEAALDVEKARPRPKVYLENDISFGFGRKQQTVTLQIHHDDPSDIRPVEIYTAYGDSYAEAMQKAIETMRDNGFDVEEGQ